MSADRELLELAAKAHGGVLFHRFMNYPILQTGNEKDGDPVVPWNPLTDDGDALRLGAAIEMELEINKGHVYCRANHGCREGFSEFDKEDTLRAMRRAIVRAAAAIGEAMT